MIPFDHSDLQDSKKIKIGYLCSYTPEEVIYAVGLQPVKLFSSGKPIRVADAYLHNTICAYTRSILDSALVYGKGDVKGMVFINSCDAMRRLYDVWRYYIKPDFTCILELPRSNTEEKINYYIGQLKSLIKQLEENFNVQITKESLLEAIGIYNENRELLRKFYELRAKDRSPISSKDAFTIILKSLSADKALFNQKIKEYMHKICALQEDEAPHPPLSPWGKGEGEGEFSSSLCASNEVRRASKINRRKTLLTGSIIDIVDIIELIENCGVRIVAEDICTGSRAFDGDIVLEGEEDPLRAIARRYLNRTPCARMKGFDMRLKFIFDLINRYGIQGVISYTLKFCDPELMFYPFLKKALEEKGIPHVHIEGDGTAGGLGQIRTRVQAFAEILDKN